jgi:hypothetical protein
MAKIEAMSSRIGDTSNILFRYLGEFDAKRNIVLYFKFRVSIPRPVLIFVVILQMILQFEEFDQADGSLQIVQFLDVLLTLV